MAVSKRLRFEILRRDNHTCRYCGRSAPHVELTVDHVLATALGGRDEASNLITACSDCNSGKSSMPADAALVEDVKQDALRWRAALQEAIRQAEQDRDAALAYRTRFEDAWNEWRWDRGVLPLDDGWEASIENFRARGLPIDHLLDCIAPAMTRPHIAAQNVFRYACGVAWNKITAIEEAAHALIEETTVPERGPKADAVVTAADTPDPVRHVRAIAFIAPPLPEPEPGPLYAYVPREADPAREMVPIEGDELADRISRAITAAAASRTHPNLVKLASQMSISPVELQDAIVAMGGYNALWSRAQQEQCTFD